MATNLIVSYDGTPNDDDALALGKLLARTGATLELAYIRHSREFDPRREELAQHDAERRLEQGAAWLAIRRFRSTSCSADRPEKGSSSWPSPSRRR